MHAKHPSTAVEGDDVVQLDTVLVRSERIEIEGDFEIVPVENFAQIHPQVAFAFGTINAVAKDGSAPVEEPGIGAVRRRRHAAVVQGILEDVPRLVERFDKEGVCGLVFQTGEGAGGDVLPLLDQTPGFTGRVGLFEPDLIADVLRRRLVVGGGFPNDENPVGGSFQYGDRPVFGGRRLRVAGIGFRGHAAVGQGILERIPRLVGSFDVEGIGGSFFQPGEGMGGNALGVLDQTPGFTGRFEPDLIADVLRRRLVVGGGFPLDGDGRLGDTCHLDCLVGDRGCLCVGSECLSRHASIINRVLAHLTGLVIGS